MADRPRHWVKLWVSWLTTPAHLELSEGALGLGPLLMLLARWDGDHDSGGWVVGENGRPLSRDALARATHRTRARLDEQIAELVACGTVTVDEHGAIGFARFGHWQETSSASRMRHARRHRDANSDANSDARSDAQTVDGRRKTVDLSLRSRSGGAPIGAETPAELAEMSRPRPRKRPTVRDPGAAAPVLAAIDEERLRHGLAVLTPTQRNPATILAALGRGATAERLVEVVRGFGRLADREPEKRDVLNATTPFTGPSATRGGGLAWGESLLDRERSGARPAARRGAAAPSPRPEVAGTLDLEDLDA